VDIGLRDGHAGAIADVGDGHRHREASGRVGLAELEPAVLERGVAEPVPEGELRLDPAGVEAPIPDQDPLGVLDDAALAGKLP
jgi:hypothetical protein